MMTQNINCHPLYSLPCVILQTIGGHLAVAPPISDVIPVLQAARCSVYILSGKTETRVVSIRDLFHNEGGTVLSKNDIIAALIIPSSTPVRSYSFLTMIQFGTVINNPR